MAKQFLDPIDEEEIFDVKEEAEEEEEEEEERPARPSSRPFKKYPSKSSSRTRSKFKPSKLVLVTGLFKNKGGSYGGKVTKHYENGDVVIPEGTKFLLFKNDFDGPDLR